MNNIVGETGRQMNPRKLNWNFCNVSERLKTRARYKQIWRWMWGCKYRSGWKSVKKVNPIHSPTLEEGCYFHYGDNEPKWLIKWKWGSCLTFTNDWVLQWGFPGGRGLVKSDYLIPLLWRRFKVSFMIIISYHEKRVQFSLCLWNKLMGLKWFYLLREFLSI